MLLEYGRLLVIDILHELVIFFDFLLEALGSLQLRRNLFHRRFCPIVCLLILDLLRLMQEHLQLIISPMLPVHARVSPIGLLLCRDQVVGEIRALA